MRNELSWCLKQRKGVRLVEPNSDLSSEYLKKSKSALRMLDAAAEIGENEWIATTSYYARYFSVYALLQACGIKCEIHDCSIALFKFLFVDAKIADEELYNEISRSKELRIYLQYYVKGEAKLGNEAEKAKKFVLKVEELVESLTLDKIGSVRNKLKKLMNDAG